MSYERDPRTAEDNSETCVSQSDMKLFRNVLEGRSVKVVNSRFVLFNAEWYRKHHRREAPSDEFAPVIHAHWEEVDAYDPFLLHGECSHCGYEQWIRDDLRFCPGCGAKMDEKEDELDETD